MNEEACMGMRGRTSEIGEKGAVKWKGSAAEAEAAVDLLHPMRRRWTTARYCHPGRVRVMQKMAG